MTVQRTNSTPFQAAQQAASDLVRTGRQGDAVSVVVMGNLPQAVIADPAFDADAVVREINRLEPRAESANLSATLTQVTAIADAARREHPHLEQTLVTFFTDGQAVTWNEANTPAVADRLKALARRATVTIETLPTADTNLAVTQVTTTEPLIRRGRPTTIRADVTAWTTAPVTTTAELLVAGRVADRQTVTIPAAAGPTGVTLPVTLTTTFPTAGETAVEVRLPGDAIPDDDRRFLAVRVRESLRVLAVGGSSADTFQLSRALDPSAAHDGPIQVQTALAGTLTRQPLSGFDAVILSNLPGLSAEASSVVNQYIQAGGTVWLLPGDRFRADGFAMLGVTVSSSDTPAAAEKPGTTADDTPSPWPVTWTIPESGQFRLAVPSEPDPLVAAVAGQPGSGLFLLPSFRIVPLRLATEETPSANPNAVRTVGDESSAVARPRVLLTFTDGQPAVVLASRGLGRIVLFAFAGSTGSLDKTADPPRQWTTLPTAGDFVSLVQELTYGLATLTERDRTRLVGDGLQGAIPGGVVGADVAMTLPNGRTRSVPIRRRAGVAFWSLSDTEQPGFYRLGGLATPAVSGNGGGLGEGGTGPPSSVTGTATLFAVNVDPAESPPAAVSPSQVANLLESLPSVTPSERPLTPDADALTEGRRRQDYPLYFAALTAVVGLLVVEGFWAWRMRRSGGGS